MDNKSTHADNAWLSATGPVSIRMTNDYLCRTFDSLHAGESYLKAKPVIQIGLLNYTLFPESLEFYATYEFRNTKNHHLYSDKLLLCVLDLSRIDLATDEDKLHRVDYWASLFKSTTWEEIKMLAKNNDYISDAASTVYRLSQEEMVRLQCEAREDYYRTQLGLTEEIDKWKESSAKYASENEALASANKTLTAEKEALATENETLTSENEKLTSVNKKLAAEKEKLLKIMAEHGIQLE